MRSFKNWLETNTPYTENHDVLRQIVKRSTA
jgi:hypothetical protein